MAYRRSTHVLEFNARARDIVAKCRSASKLSSAHRDLTDMVFQCGIFQTCAALETYLKLLIESWAHEIRARALHIHLPDNTRGFLAAKRFERHFSKYAYIGEETALSASIAAEYKTWPILDTNSHLPHYFNGAILHSETTYPTLKNIKRLFARVGLEAVDGKLAAILKRDVEAMIEGFQSVRTALAHSAPPDVTMKDVRRLVQDMIALAGAIDKAFYSHVSKHGGPECWSSPVV